jgi:hypothetical protein
MKTLTKEESLIVTGNKFMKKFEGICGYCGKQGHKKETCFKKKQEDGEIGKGGGSNNNSEGEKGKVKKPNIICF